MRRRVLLGLCAGLAGCGVRRPRSDRTGSGTTTSSDSTSLAPDAAEGLRSAAGTYGYTHLRADGNRYVEGRGDVPSTDPVDVSVPGRPTWIVGVPRTGGSLWTVVLRDGRVVWIRLTRGSVTTRTTERRGEGPPLLAITGGEPTLLAGGSALTHPVPVPGTAGLASVHTDGSLALPDGTLPLDLLPDARIVTAGGQLFVFGGATDQYGHGVLGDAVEARHVVVVDPSTSSVERTIPSPDGAVLEGVAPTVARLGGDRAVIVTASDDRDGARLLAFDSTGGLRATGPPVGTGFRWRHQLAVAPFAPDETAEIAVVRTPHVGGVAEFYRLDDDDLRLVATRSGYSTHRIGSRNLDMAAAGDFDGDGRVELLVPDEPQVALAALRRTRDGVTEAWRVPVGGTLLTNIGAVATDDTLVLAAGRERTVRFWSG